MKQTKKMRTTHEFQLIRTSSETYDAYCFFYGSLSDVKQTHLATAQDVDKAELKLVFKKQTKQEWSL